MAQMSMPLLIISEARVRIQSSATTFIEEKFTVCRKDEEKKKRPGMINFYRAPIELFNIFVEVLRTDFSNLYFYLFVSATNDPILIHFV